MARITALSHTHFAPFPRHMLPKRVGGVGDGVCSAQHVCLRFVANETFDVVLPVLLNLVSGLFVSAKSGSPS